MEEQLNLQLPPGTTECNHSYYTGNSFSASHSVLQLQNAETANSVQPLTHTQQANDAASSGSVSSPPLPCSTISPQVPVCPSRNVTGEVMPLAQAITQLSFLEFLQHCGVPLAPPQPSQLPVPISFVDAAVQTNQPGDVFQDVSTQTSDQQSSSLSFDVAVQTSSHGIHILSLDAAVQTTSPSTLFQHVSTQMGSRALLPRSLLMCLFRLLYAVMCHTMLPHNYRSRSSSLDVSTRMIPWTAQTSFVSPRHQYKVHVPCCSRRQDSNSQPRLLSLPLTLTCLLHMVRLLPVFPVMPCSRLSVPPTWEHTLYAQLLAPKEVLVPPLREPTILLVLILVQEQVLFPKPQAVVLPMVKFGQPKSDRLGHIDTVDSDLMHHQFRLSLLQWNPGPARRNPTNIVSAACGKFHAVFLQEASDHVPHISDQFRAYTNNTDLAILLNKDTF